MAEEPKRLHHLIRAVALTPEEANMVEAFRKFKQNMLADHATFQWTTYDHPSAPTPEDLGDPAQYLWGSDALEPGARFGFNFPPENTPCR